jgi:hypothetical protein
MRSNKVFQGTKQARRRVQACNNNAAVFPITSLHLDLSAYYTDNKPAMLSSNTRNAVAGPSSSSGFGARANGGRLAGPARPTKLQVIPSTWEGTISAPIEEKDRASNYHLWTLKLLIKLRGVG